jgi:AraC-like DNA-binding protein
MLSDISPSAPTLGQAAAVYAERAVFAPLQRHFVCTWFHRVPADRPRSTLVVPDGCMDLLWVNGDLRIAGPDREAKIESIPAGSTVVGLRFQPGAASAWLRIPVSEIVGARVPLESFWGAEARGLADWISEGGTPEGTAQRLERALADKASEIAAPSDMPRYIMRLIEEGAHSGAHIVHHLRDELAMSERTLLRRCRETFGYGPKTLDRILRFQRFLRLAGAPGHGGMAGLAAEAGYADQPHLIRETRQLSGLTPSAVLAQLAG